MNTLDTDILILGAGGAGLFAALHAKKANPDLDVTIAVKGLLGKCGCTRMVQGGYNVALSPEDSVERHFMDTIEGGAWLNDQDLAWLLVETAPRRIRELETELGCFFDRNPDGTVHQKAFAGQTFDRTVHKGDLTGIEIINRLAEQVWRRDVRRIEDHRALDLIPSADGSELAGVLMLDMRSGELQLVRARATLLATGGGPTMYRYHTPSGDKSCDGLAMALRAGLPLRDIEMVQFHPTGLLAGEGTRMTGTVLEEGLRGSGGYLTDAQGKRFMFDYDPRGERATRDIVSRAIMDRIRQGHASPHGGVYIEMGHLGPERVRREFKGMVERCADCGFDLAAGRVEVIPTAHYMMGGVSFRPDCTTELPRLYAAGEDTGGVHGANRLGGNGVANSTVYGGIAGDIMGARTARSGPLPEPDKSAIEVARARAFAPIGKTQGDLPEMRERLYDIMWNDVGILRDAQSLARAQTALEQLSRDIEACGVAGGDLRYNLTWMDRLNLENLTLVSRAICAAADFRKDSRGAHFREDFPAPSDLATSAYTSVRLSGGRPQVASEPVAFTRVRPGESLLKQELINVSKPGQDEIRRDDFSFVYLDVDNPNIAWLVYRGLLNSPDIATVNPGQISWFLVDVLKRGLVSTLRREGALEGYRVKEFPQATSRLKCVYAYPTIEDAERGNYGRGKFRKENLVAIAPATDAFRVDTYDAQWITDFDSLPVATARRYWSGEHTRSPHLESLLCGRFFILGTNVRTRAYQTIKRVWPNALALLELSRLAVEFTSDFGSISPWVIREGGHTFVRHIIRYDDKEGPEILRRAMDKAKDDPQFQVNWADLEPLRLPPENRDADERFKVPDSRPYDHELRTDKLDELNKFIGLVLK